MCDLDLLWSQMIDAFPMLNGTIGSSRRSKFDKEGFKNVAKQFATLDLIDTFNEIFELELRSYVRTNVAHKFWSYFSLDHDTHRVLERPCSQVSSSTILHTKYKLFRKFIHAVHELNTIYQYLEELKERLIILNSYCEANATKKQNIFNPNRIREIFHECLLALLPIRFNTLVKCYCWFSFRIFSKVQKNNSMVLEPEMAVLNEVNCSGCNSDPDDCCCDDLILEINDVHRKLLNMNLLDRLAGNAMTKMIEFQIKDHISEACHGIFDRSHLKQLEMWLDMVVISWLKSVFHDARDEDKEITEKAIEGFKVKLTYYLYEKFAHSVIDQFFSIIIDFPDSIPAIDDLKICMEKIDMRKHLTTTLRSSLEARILHPGVNTMDILTGYVATIKAVRHLDSSGVILETVTAPVKDYLRKRTDTVRRVVTGLTEEGPTDLSEELAKGEAAKEGKNSATSDELNNWETWQPDPFGIETNTSQNSKFMRSADIITMVVDIYGSKELFMIEYRNLMADRLLTQLDFNSEKEIRNLELLKIRFGETLLHSCEVMLKDVTDSKRINSHIQGDNNYVDSKTFDISSLIISAQFWPSFNKESLELPEEIEKEFKKYTKSYEAYKGNRTLNWRTVTGRVDIVIEIGSRIIEMTVPPTQAVIIYHFQNKSEWTLDDLSNLIKVPPTVLRRRINFWQNNGLISEPRPGVFKLMEEDAQKAKFEEMNVTDADDDLESAMASASDQREEELQVFWSYIVGMLTNLDSLSIERIHQMLKLFASHGGGVEFTLEELKHFLQGKVREHKLLFSGGVYQLAK